MDLSSGCVMCQWCDFRQIPSLAFRLFTRGIMALWKNLDSNITYRKRWGKIEDAKFVQNNWFKPLGEKKNEAPINWICSAECIVKE